MNKFDKYVELLLDSLKEASDIERVIDALPRGYISVKSISGHTYYYRQWREGDKIISSYIPEPYVSGVRQKIVIRKENEQLLKIIRKDISSAIKKILKLNLLSEEEITKLKEGTKAELIPLLDRKEYAHNHLSNINDELEKDIDLWVKDLTTFNRLYLTSLGK